MIQGRSSNNDLIKKAFIENVLKQEGENIARAQDRVLSSAAPDKRIDMVRFSRSFSVSNGTLTHTHNIQQRFIDMKRTRIGKQKPIPVHNKIIFRHLNRVIYRLSNDLTKALKAQLAQNLNMETYG